MAGPGASVIVPAMRIERTIETNGRKVHFAVEDSSVGAGNAAGINQLVAILNRITQPEAKDGQENDSENPVQETRSPGPDRQA